jgi:hypothetical protein
MVVIQGHTWDLTNQNQPCSVRNDYYGGIGRFWEKDEYSKLETQKRARPQEIRCFYGNYGDVIRNTGIMRERYIDWLLDHEDERPDDDDWPEEGWPTLEVCRDELLMPFEWLVDATRSVDDVESYDSVSEALEDLAEYFLIRRWSMQERRVETWAESDSTKGIVRPVTRRYRVPNYSCRGQSGKKLVWDATQKCIETGKPVTVFGLGDHDSSGVAIPRSVEERRERYSGGEVDIDYIRLAVTPDDVRGGEYQSHEVNTADPNYGAFVQHCREHDLDPEKAVEAEAIPAPELRQRLEDAIRAVIDWDAWREADKAEEAATEILYDLAESSKDLDRLKRAIQMTRAPRLIRRRLRRPPES